MPTFIIRDRQTGRVKLDLSSRLTKLLGNVTANGQSGSITVPGFADGDPWFAVSPFAINNLSAPEVTVSRASRTLSWDYRSTVFVPVVITYGIF